MQKQILTAHGEGKALAEIFKVSGPTIRKALKGRSKSKLALQIRQAAIERGGKES